MGIARIVDRGSRIVSLRHYPVTGSTYDEIRSSIQNNGVVPGGLAGFTSFTFRSEQTEKSLLLVGKEVQVALEYSVEITLPELQSHSLSEMVTRDWNYYQQRLYLHELNHVRIYFAAVDRMLLVKEPSRFARIVDESKRLSEGYDNATHHGISEGCVLGGPFTVQDFHGWIDQALRRLAAF
jgi:hypothetical protein